MKIVTGGLAAPPAGSGGQSRDDAALDAGGRGAERRIMGIALAWWEEARRGQPAASLVDVPLDHPVLGPHLYLLRVDATFPESVVVHCGGILESLCARPVISHKVGEIFPRAMAQDMVEYLAAAAGAGKPMAQSGSLVRPDGREILYRDAVMPLREPLSGGLCLLGALSYRVER